MKAPALLLMLIAGGMPASGARHAIFAEAGGSALAYSLNYEYGPWRHGSLRAGLGCFDLSLFGDGDPGCAVPLGAGFLWDGGPHMLEAGGGPLLWFDLSPGSRNRMTSGIGLNAGYRYQPRADGIFFRASFTPIVVLSHFGESDFRMNVLPWLGLSAGYTFRDPG
jgi:hypothetical protein